MSERKKIVIIIGSATKNSSNFKLMENTFQQNQEADFIVYDDLSILPHFDTEHTDINTPAEVLKIREDINSSAGVVFSTPEYIFSIPSRLKNLLEWFVSTTIFNEKPTAVVTASANGEKGHEELLLILKTLGAKVDDHQLLIKGIKGRFERDGSLKNDTFAEISKLMKNFEKSIHN
ncbi:MULTISPECIES: NADPH-dependent FMN reductase [unclassified Chryseobacterium]|uniref:NADPH-dependent FMN reductase n=1 Tax=unclassified Chryseobacterium TaxID=2593645 RepID=UPI00226A1BF8|nr:MULTISPECIES: NADPH-dependent FMN reductase [unclassified Chryseobacterium]